MFLCADLKFNIYVVISVYKRSTKIVLDEESTVVHRLYTIVLTHTLTFRGSASVGRLLVCLLFGAFAHTRVRSFKNMFGRLLSTFG